jgi:hypothetical protein
MKRQLQDCINTATRFKINLELTHNTNGLDRDEFNEDSIVWHEPILDEYWNQLEAKIDGMKQLEIDTDIMQGICNIQIVNVEMKKERMAALVDIFCSRGATNSSTQVNFINANLCAAGIISLSELVDVSSKLIWLFLNHNPIDNMDSARRLSRSLKCHTCINELDLAYCDLGSSPEILSVILQSDVNHINLSNNNINSLGAANIAEYLESDPPIHCLSLVNNHLNDDDAILISQALKRNTNLTALHIHTNNFTSISVKALLTCIFDSSSLNTISRSNHTLKRIQIFNEFKTFVSFSHYLYHYIDKLLKLDRSLKIILALQDKESLLKHFINIPMKLIPEVLVFPHG